MIKSKEDYIDFDDRQRQPEINFDEPPEVSDADLKTITALAQKQLDLERIDRAYTKALDENKKELRKVSEVDLPDAMNAIGMESFTLSTGHKIEITEKLYASIPKKNKKECAAWLVDHGHSALIKEVIMLAFDKGEHEKVMKLYDRLNVNFDPILDESINTGSVKSLIKELQSSDPPVTVPLELFGAFWLKKAEIKT